MRRWALRVAVAVSVLVPFALLDLSGGSIACGSVPVRVRGVVVNARTGAPVEGASLLTLHDPAMASEPTELNRWRQMAPPSDMTRDRLLVLPCHIGSARSNAAGAFEIIVGIGSSEKTDWLGIVWHRERGSAFNVARALLVEKEAYATLVHETKDARWDETPDGEIVGTLDVGTIRLVPAGPR